MNIFYLDQDPRRCAAAHCDKHVVKMILEYTQLLCTAHHVFADETAEALAAKGFYKPTHHNHPCAVWVRRSDANYRWLWGLLAQLHLEYTARFGKVHKSKTLLGDLWHPPASIARRYHVSDLPACVPQDCQRDTVIEAYRAYYNVHKSRFAEWRYSAAPAWYTPMEIAA